MSGNAMRRMTSAAHIMLVSVPISVLWEYVDSGSVSYIGVLVGGFLAGPLVAFDGSRFDVALRRLPFSIALLARAIAYTAALIAVFQSVAVIVGMIRGRTPTDSLFPMTDPEFLYMTGAGFILYVTIVFFRQLDRLLGPGVLMRYLRGQYHTPRRESRVFMFLDLKSSTSLGETLGPERYYALVNEFFRDISAPVLNSGGEIYEYVGDEAVITWKQDRGLRNADCLRAFFDLDDAIEQKKSWYLDRFGVVPEYKAGVHLGEVITAEIGDLKRGLVFNGDVLNTGARIQGECGRLGRRLLASASLVARMEIPRDLASESMGPVHLRGKAEPMELVAFA